MEIRDILQSGNQFAGESINIIHFNNNVYQKIYYFHVNIVLFNPALPVRLVHPPVILLYLIHKTSFVSLNGLIETILEHIELIP